MDFIPLESSSLSNEVLKELYKVENERRENQYNDVLQSFKRNIKDGTGLQLFYNAIIYDDIRERLEKEGFNVKTVTANSAGRVAYLITAKEEMRKELKVE